jgi:hypothetical protein
VINFSPEINLTEKEAQFMIYRFGTNPACSRAAAFGGGVVVDPRIAPVSS